MGEGDALIATRAVRAACQAAGTPAPAANADPPRHLCRPPRRAHFKDDQTRFLNLKTGEHEVQRSGVPADEPHPALLPGMADFGGSSTSHSAGPWTQPLNATRTF